MLDVKRMRVLREVAASGSFSAAAETIHVSQSAVSQHVAALEREVGLPLLERTSAGPRLTSAGEALVDHADAVIARLEEAERELAEIAGLEGGRLRLVSFPTASATVMTRAMAEFKRRFPSIELQFAEDEPEDSFPALKRGDFDLAVIFDYPGFPLELGRDAEAELIFEEPMRVALPLGHDLARADAVDLSDLSEEEWLCGALPSSCRSQVIEACRTAGFEPRISFESDDYEVLKALVAAGLGVTILPELAGGHPEIVLRDVVPNPPTRRVWAVTRAEHSRSPAAAQMLAVLHEVCGGLKAPAGSLA